MYKWMEGRERNFLQKYHGQVCDLMFEWSYTMSWIWKEWAGERVENKTVIQALKLSEWRHTIGGFLDDSRGR